MKNESSEQDRLFEVTDATNTNANTNDDDDDEFDEFDDETTRRPWVVYITPLLGVIVGAVFYSIIGEVWLASKYPPFYDEVYTVAVMYLIPTVLGGVTKGRFNGLKWSFLVPMIFLGSILLSAIPLKYPEFFDNIFPFLTEMLKKIQK